MIETVQDEQSMELSQVCTVISKNTRHIPKTAVFVPENSLCVPFGIHVSLLEGF
ncbi:hypothetical protein [Algoriphagus vanfongensis]|uniref:hypothetical protein n=1 Tax=Algoriphagus vanfongensis TaxID=426371 RepID=UPI000404111C|nr:hypothetical protein [Algoriphagus vanfongensis]